MHCSFNVMFRFFFSYSVPGYGCSWPNTLYIGHVVNRFYGWYIPSVIICTTSFIRVLEQHSCVLGLCLMALDVHPWMLRPAHYGCCLIGCFAALHAYRFYLLAMPKVSSVLKSMELICMDFLFASLLFKVFLPPICYETLSLECSGC